MSPSQALRRTSRRSCSASLCTRRATTSSPRAAATVACCSGTGVTRRRPSRCTRRDGPRRTLPMFGDCSSAQRASMATCFRAPPMARCRHGESAAAWTSSATKLPSREPARACSCSRRCPSTRSTTRPSMAPSSPLRTRRASSSSTSADRAAGEWHERRGGGTSRDMSARWMARRQHFFVLTPPKDEDTTHTAPRPYCRTLRAVQSCALLWPRLQVAAMRPSR
mmetsp:Transcript_18553/g.42563  ORF Transcript_18553/g.42563 Transcript_18553/m.42563 type:complete len:223 (-) Transcript_18553:350-1018(-)